MGNHLKGMPMDHGMWLGMALIAIGVPLACFGALPKVRGQHGDEAGTNYEAPDSTPLGRWHAATLLVLTLGLVIDVMKPATLGFVLPGLSAEYAIAKSEAALLPLIALTGTTVGSFMWGWLADVHGRRVSILLSTILFVSTAICGAMPAFAWNLVMCFLMGISAGGMLPVIYTLLAEVMPPQLGAGAGRRDRVGGRLPRGERGGLCARAGLWLARAVAAGFPERTAAARACTLHPRDAAVPRRNRPSGRA
jgi:putative MFS transporter